MIAYEDLVNALAQWRDAQGMPTSALTFDTPEGSAVDLALPVSEISASPTSEVVQLDDESEGEAGESLDASHDDVDIDSDDYDLVSEDTGYENEETAYQDADDSQGELSQDAGDIDGRDDGFDVMEEAPVHEAPADAVDPYEPTAMVNSDVFAAPSEDEFGDPAADLHVDMNSDADLGEEVDMNADMDTAQVEAVDIEDEMSAHDGDEEATAYGADPEGIVSEGLAYADETHYDDAPASPAAVEGLNYEGSDVTVMAEEPDDFAPAADEATTVGSPMEVDDDLDRQE